MSGIFSEKPEGLRIQNDHLGTSQKIVDTNGRIVWPATCESFGNVQITIAEVENNLRFPGQYYDAETGLYYNWNRYYDPTIGRYLQTDPFHEGMNLYVYVFANPVNLIDSEGLHVLRAIKYIIKPFSDRAYQRALQLYQGGYNDVRVFTIVMILSVADLLPSGQFAEAITGIDSTTGEGLDTFERLERFTLATGETLLLAAGSAEGKQFIKNFHIRLGKYEVKLDTNYRRGGGGLNLRKYTDKGRERLIGIDFHQWAKTTKNTIIKGHLNDKGSFNGLNANIYSLESITKRKFFFPDFFSCFTQFFDNLILTHLINGRRILGDYFSYFIQMFFSFLGIFHYLSPHFCGIKNPKQNNSSPRFKTTMEMRICRQVVCEFEGLNKHKSLCDNMCRMKKE